jgi:hypothetical protein
MDRTFKRLKGGLLAAAMLAGGGSALALGVTPAGASNKQVTAAGSFTTYQLMHALFPTSLNDLLPGGSTAHQTIAATPKLCAGGESFATTPKGAPNGSTAGKTALFTEQSAAATAQECITFARSSSPPEAATIVGSDFDYYAYALDGVAPMVGTNAGGSVTGTTAAFTLAEIRGIYHCTAGHTTWKTLGGKTGAIVRFWPQTGSGTRSVYKTILGFTPSKAATKGTCATPATTAFTVAGVSQPNEENTESGLVYATKVLHDTIKDAIFIYSAGKFTSQWNNQALYSATGHNRINGATIGNFTSTKVEFASIRLRNTTGTLTNPTGTPEPFVKFTATTGGRTTFRVGVNSATVTEANEWYSHIPLNTDPGKTSTSTVPGVRYVYNVCDTGLSSYDTCKAMVGFDNQKHTQATTQTNGAGTKSRLCAGNDTATIEAVGFLPLSKSGHAGTSTANNLATATCREFPGGTYPGLAGAKSWTFNTYVNPTA